MAMMHMEVLRLDFQIKNIIAASEIEAGETANYYSRVDFNEIFEDAKKSFYYIIKDKELSVNISNELNDSINSDGQKIYLICLNLLSNACEYSYAKGVINVRVLMKDENVVIIFEDMGEGIISDNKLLVYNRFTQFNRGINRTKTGLGLGLSVVKGMSEALGGSVDYESEPEKLTSFIVTIPIIQDGNKLMSGGSNDVLFEDFDNALEM